MAGRLIPSCIGMMHKQALTLLLVVAAAALPALPALAQPVLPDPTRPPAGLAQEGGQADAAALGPVLESVVIPGKGRPLAVISGRQVRLGEKYGDSRLVRLNEREAVLDGPSGVERLLLTPGIEKTNSMTMTTTTKNSTKASSSAGARSGSKP